MIGEVRSAPDSEKAADDEDYSRLLHPALGIPPEFWLDPLGRATPILSANLLHAKAVRGGKTATNRADLSVTIPEAFPNRDPSGSRPSVRITDATPPPIPVRRGRAATDVPAVCPTPPPKSPPAASSIPVDRSHQSWFLAVLGLTLLSIALYVVLPSGPRHGKELGFGAVGTGLVLFCGLLPVRKKLLRIRSCAPWRILRSSAWEIGHIYLGLLSWPVLLFHARFRVGGC